MSRGRVWWGTGPLVVGASGLALLAFGAQGMQDGDPAEKMAKETAKRIKDNLEGAASPEAKMALVREEALLKMQGKEVDLRSLVPKTKPGEEVDAEQISSQAYDRIYEALKGGHTSDNALAERLTFYAGLVLVFGAGVLLYLRTPESVRGTW